MATKHGQNTRKYKTPTYKTWYKMKARCYNPNHISYIYYGGKGIKVCDRWLTFENFYADVGDRPNGYTLDRIDHNSNYYPDNCRWADKKTQAREKIGNRCAAKNRDRGVKL